jgi:hypothetical protein
MKQVTGDKSNYTGSLSALDAENTDLWCLITSLAASAKDGARTKKTRYKPHPGTSRHSSTSRG